MKARLISAALILLALVAVCLVAQQQNSGTGADTVSNASLSFQQTAGDPTLRLLGAAQYVFNGTTWDRQRGSVAGGTTASVGAMATGADAFANTTGFLFKDTTGTGGAPEVLQLLFNGTTWDRWRAANLANFSTSATITLRNSIGAAVVEKGSRWSVVSAPAAGSAASASIASEASVRHVADCLSFSATASAAITTNSLTVVLRDGASGAGTIVWEFLVNPINTGTGAQSVQPHSVCGLNLVGATATAMTAEFSAGVVSVSQAISISGYNVN